MTSLACLSLILLVYTYFGYPVLIAMLARLRPRHPVMAPASSVEAAAAGAFEPTVTVCISVFNAEAHVDRKLASTVGLDYPAGKLEILVYSDGATYGTPERVRAWCLRDPRIKLLRGESRLGKPTGLNRMREAAAGEVLLLTDVRQELDPGALRALVAALADPQVGCVSGELMLRGGTGVGLYWRYEKWIRQSESRFRSVVGISGAIAAIRRVDMPHLASDLLLDDLWIPMHLRMQRRIITFCEGALAYDDAFEDSREWARKVRTLAGNFQLFGRMPELLVPLVNPSWFETVSHKVLRLVCPLALAALLFATFAAPLTGAMGAVAVGQFLFYGAAVAGPRAGRVGSLARTFVVLNAAVAVGFWKFLTRGQKVTW